jgi:BolA protein
MSAGTSRIEEIRARLTEAFSPTTLEVIDESHKHKGHAGARDGRGHFSVTIVSSRFADKKTIERHRMVLRVLDELLKTDIHALSVRAHCPGERTFGD